MPPPKPMAMPRIEVIKPPSTASVQIGPMAVSMMSASPPGPQPPILGEAA